MTSGSIRGGGGTGSGFDAWPFLARVRETAPLVHNITNYVAMNNSANALLAAGASPAMVHAVEEVAEFTAISRALVVNIGTLSAGWVEAMHLAAREASAHGIPWVLDPVAAGATRFRTTTAADLLAHAPTVIRANASEIMVVSGTTAAGGKGVDSAHASDDALSSALSLARSAHTIVAMTGEVDYVTDGTRTVSIRNGHPMMGRVTALGCSLSSMAGAFLGANENAFDATVAALAVFAVAGEIAAEGAPGPGTLQLRLLDALYALDEQTLSSRARIAEVV